MTHRAGVVTAVVEEVHAEQGRVRVEYRDMQQSLLSPWAYIAAPMSGKKRGMLFMPERGDEVLICYGDGDFDHPYVVGFLWDGDQTSPETEAHNRVILTPGGNTLRFEDKEGNKRIVLKTKSEHILQLDDKDKFVVLETTGHHKLRIEDNGGKVILTTKDGGKVTLENTGKATVEASQNIITLGPEGITIEAKAGTLNVKSQTATTIQSSAAMTIMSSAAMNIQASAAVSLTAGAALNVTAGLANFTGAVKCTALITDVVASKAYVPTYGTILP